MNNDINYSKLVNNTALSYEERRISSAKMASGELLRFYWNLGKDITDKHLNAEEIETLINEIHNNFVNNYPVTKGISIITINNACRFYQLYCKYIKPSEDSPLWHISWNHHIIILENLNKVPLKAFLYVIKTMQEGWTTDELLRQIKNDKKNDYTENDINIILDNASPKESSVQQIIKDPYLFDFLGYTSKFKNAELKKILQQKLVRFLLKKDIGFAYINKDYPIQIGDTEEFIDLLFYNLNMRCFFVIKVETEDLKSGHISQIGTQIIAVNHILKQKFDNPTIGLFVCKNRDKVLAQYSLESNNQYIGISDYELSGLYPKEFRSSLPSIEDIELNLK